MTTRFILIRHGETAWNKKKRYQGRTNTGLTAKGKKQAQAIARGLKSDPVDLFYTSPLKRARQTAGIIAKTIGKKFESDKRLRELHFGDWEGQTAEELSAQKDPVFLKWRKGRFVTPPGGEPLNSLRKRIRGFLRDCLKKHRGKKIAIVSHAGPIKVLIFEALKLPLRSLWSVQIDPASVSSLSIHPHFVQLNYLNRSVSQKTRLAS